HLVDAKYNAVASILPQPANGNFPVGQNLQNTFLFAPVFNFPNEFAGPSSKIALSSALPTSSSAAAVNIGAIFPFGSGIILIGPTTTGGAGSINIGPVAAAAAASSAGAIIPPQAAFGIWNGASVMSLLFTQRHDQY